MLLPNMEYATTQQVADFYNTTIKNVGNIIQRNTDELIEDGYVKVNGKDLVYLKMRDTKIENKRGYILLNDSIKIPYNDTGLFPKRAILRVGMLLRDSEVAKEVRTQLLNIEEKTNKQIKVVDINEELILQTNIVKAFAKGVRTQLLNIEENATKEDD